MSTFTLRKVERYTNWEASAPVEFDPNDFTELSNPFEVDTGEEEEFTKYLLSLYEDDWYGICDELESLGKIEVADNLSILFEGDMETYSSTADKGEDSWLESGVEDESYSKYGGFKSSFTTMS
tara:strand:+ start:180 stop:548 length:369 start_codon:yes stop_codon:yes gene_type:complete